MKRTLTPIPIITEWGADPWTPTGSWTANVTYTGWKRRVADTGEFRVVIDVTGTPTSASLTITLPHTIDTTKMEADVNNNGTLGIGSMHDSGTSFRALRVGYSSTTAVSVFYDNAANSFMSAVTQAAPVSFASGDQIDLFFKVPILGWRATRLG